MDATRLSTVDYQYSLYNEYLDQVDEILIKYGKSTGLAIQYWHIRIDESLNYDGIGSGDLRMQNSYKHYVYDILHFIPTIDMTPVTYQIGYDGQQQGTSNVGTGSFSMYLIDKPLPGDMFRFYGFGDDPENPAGDSTDRDEVFRVTNVRYMRTSKNTLGLYQIDFETAPILTDTLDHLRINTIQCWDQERFLFLNEDECQHASEIPDRRNELIDLIGKYYDEVNGWYGMCLNNDGALDCAGRVTRDCTGSTTRPLVFVNTILKRLKRIFDAMDIKPIFGIGTAKIPIDWGTLEPDNPPDDVYGDYWDTFKCLSFQNGDAANSGELFNVTQILAGNCHECPPELVQEIECHRGLVLLVQELVLLMLPLLTTTQRNERECDKRCCDSTDPAYIANCAAQGTLSGDFSVFWDYAGPNAGDNAKDFCEQYENGACVPLYITWKDGAHWPTGGITQ